MSGALNSSASCSQQVLLKEAGQVPARSASQLLLMPSALVEVCSCHIRECRHIWGCPKPVLCTQRGCKRPRPPPHRDISTQLFSPLRSFGSDPGIPLPGRSVASQRLLILVVSMPPKHEERLSPGNPFAPPAGECGYGDPCWRGASAGGKFRGNRKVFARLG